MSKLYDDPIEVVVGGLDGAPRRFRWRGGAYAVDQQVASWCVARDRNRPAPGRTRGVADAEIFRVVARRTSAANDARAVYDLACADGAWRLIRLWD